MKSILAITMRITKSYYGRIWVTAQDGTEVLQKQRLVYSNSTVKDNFTKANFARKVFRIKVFYCITNEALNKQWKCSVSQNLYMFSASMRVVSAAIKT